MFSATPAYVASAALPAGAKAAVEDVLSLYAALVHDSFAFICQLVTAKIQNFYFELEFEFLTSLWSATSIDLS